MALTPRELQLITLCLDMAADKFGNASCNDFSWVDQAGITSQKERKALNVAIETYNSGEDSEETIELKEDNGSHEYAAADFCVMYYLRKRCEEELEALHG